MERSSIVHVPYSEREPYGTDRALVALHATPNNIDHYCLEHLCDGKRLVVLRHFQISRTNGSTGTRLLYLVRAGYCSGTIRT